MLSNGLCYPPCPLPLNDAPPTWSWSIDGSSHGITCTLASCPAGSKLCGTYCVKDADAGSLGGACSSISSVRRLAMGLAEQLD